MKSCLPRSSASNRGIIVLFTIVAGFCVVPASAEDTTDVTAVVAAAVKDNKLSIDASNQTFGDTAPGIPKKLHVEYRAGEEKLQRDVNEGGKLEIAAPVGKKLVITKAVYGPADGSRPVSVENASEVLDALPGFKIEHILRADAKTNGSWICLAKDPRDGCCSEVKMGSRLRG